LIFDLVADSFRQIPQAWWNYDAEAFRAAEPLPQADGVPHFLLFERKPMHPAYVLFGSVLSLSVLFALMFVVRHAPSYRPFDSGGESSSPIERVMQRLNRPIAPESAANSALPLRGFDSDMILPSPSGNPVVPIRGKAAPEGQKTTPAVVWDRSRQNTAISSCQRPQERLVKGNQLYIDLSNLPGQELCRETQAGQLSAVSQGSAAVLDLRQTRGATGNAVEVSRLKPAIIYILVSEQTSADAASLAERIRQQHGGIVVGKSRFLRPDIAVRAENALTEAESRLGSMHTK
jgi:hypothetical protein